VRQPGERGGLAREQDVARILALERCPDHQTVRQPSRQILRRMHREVDPPVEQGQLQLLAEQPLAAEIGERAVGNAVPGGPHHHDLEGSGSRELGIGAAKRTTHEVGLGPGQPRAARADAQTRAAAHSPLLLIVRLKPYVLPS